MSDPTRISMTVSDLLAWAWDETQIADALEETGKELAMIPTDRLNDTVARHRTRSRWLDEQCALRLDQEDALDQAGR